jgi:outer membrane lipoprotein carrier protein
MKIFAFLLIFPAILLAAPPEFSQFARADAFRMAEILREFDAAREKSTTFSADVVQTKHLTILNEPVVASGHIDFAAPNKFRWELREPARSLTVCNGIHLWLHYPDFGQTEQYTIVGATEDSARQAIAPILAAFSDSSAEWQKNYAATVYQTPDWYLFELVPKDKTMREFIRTIRLWMQRGDFIMRKLELTTTNGDKTVSEFSNVTVGAPIPDETFTFVPLPEKK